METKIVARAELQRVGHLALTAILDEVQDGIVPLSPDYARCAELFIKVGILATLLRIEEDLSRLLGVQNMSRLIQEEER